MSQSSPDLPGGLQLYLLRQRKPSQRAQGEALLRSLSPKARSSQIVAVRRLRRGGGHGAVPTGRRFTVSGALGGLSGTRGGVAESTTRPVGTAPGDASRNMAAIASWAGPYGIGSVLATPATRWPQGSSTAPSKASRIQPIPGHHGTPGLSGIPARIVMGRQ